MWTCICIYSDKTKPTKYPLLVTVTDLFCACLWLTMDKFHVCTSESVIIVHFGTRGRPIYLSHSMKLTSIFNHLLTKNASQVKMLVSFME